MASGLVLLPSLTCLFSWFNEFSHSLSSPAVDVRHFDSLFLSLFAGHVGCSQGLPSSEGSVGGHCCQATGEVSQGTPQKE